MFEANRTVFKVVSYLLQSLHVFEVESNVKKAEIRIYKLKLQEKKSER